MEFKRYQRVLFNNGKNEIFDGIITNILEDSYFVDIYLRGHKLYNIIVDKDSTRLKIKE